MVGVLATVGVIVWVSDVVAVGGSVEILSGGMTVSVTSMEGSRNDAHATIFSPNRIMAKRLITPFIITRALRDHPIS
jgi:hypothetical protein